MNQPLLFLTLLIGLLKCPSLSGQDPFFIHFHNNKVFFNPAMVGHRGALSFSAKLKRQWETNGQVPYQSGTISIEDSWPCGRFDFGLLGSFDEEGDGLLRTYDGGFAFAGMFGHDSPDFAFNIRIGGKLGYGVQSIDFSRLTFSDQLDPKYGLFDAFGNRNPTAFPFPENNLSDWFFTPGVGVVGHFIFNRRKAKKPPTLVTGLSFYNVYRFGREDNTGQSNSILNTGGSILQRRYVFFAEPEFVTFDFPRGYISLSPLFLYQSQDKLFGKLSYLELGNKVNLSRLFSLGMYYHSSGSNESGTNTNWFSFSATTGVIIDGNQRIDLGFALAPNISGLRNAFGPSIELSLTWHIAKSVGCSIAGKGDEVPYGNTVKCPNVSFARKKMYENIWYKSK